MAKDHIRDYDKTAGNNTDVDGVNIAEGTAPSNINDAIREVMSHQAELHEDTRGGLTSGGSMGAYTLTTGESLAAYAQSGGLFCFEANHAMPDTATATLNIDAVGAKAIRKHVSVNLDQNDIKANQMVIVAYEGTTDVFHIISSMGLDADAFPATTAMVFYQDTAPPGYTIAAAVDEHGLRLTKGSGAGGQAGGATGGTVNFSTVFGLTATDSYTLLIADIPAHTHNVGKANDDSATGSGHNYAGNTASAVSGSTGGGGGHAHNIDLRVKWAACIVATKD
jgi:hypothetical protein